MSSFMICHHNSTFVGHHDISIIILSYITWITKKILTTVIILYDLNKYSYFVVSGNIALYGGEWMDSSIHD